MQLLFFKEGADQQRIQVHIKDRVYLPNTFTPGHDEDLTWSRRSRRRRKKKKNFVFNAKSTMAVISGTGLNLFEM